MFVFLVEENLWFFVNLLTKSSPLHLQKSICSPFPKDQHELCSYRNYGQVHTLLHRMFLSTILQCTTSPTAIDSYTKYFNITLDLQKSILYPQVSISLYNLAFTISLLMQSCLSFILSSHHAGFIIELFLIQSTLPLGHSI